MPRSDPNLCDEKTDIFAQGTAIYVMICGLPTFSDLDPDEDEDEIQRRFRAHEFPPLGTIQAGSIV
jgi:hypothetical protein